jgi:envelope integrity protein B
MARALMAILALSLLCLPRPAGTAELIPHHAFYSLKLGTKNGQSAIVEASGGMAIEVSETCDAWLTKQRLRLRIVREEGEEVVTDNNFTSWEAKDGLKYRFSVRNRLNGEVNEEFRGEAELKPNGGGGMATFTQPKRSEVALPEGALFPTAHVAALIDAARKGTRVFRRTVFDGATIDGPDEINAVVGRPSPLEKLPGLDKKTGTPAWPMRWAFFPIGGKSPAPEYELDMRMLEDGVVIDVGLVYEDFEVNGKVDYFEPLPRPKC